MKNVCSIVAAAIIATGTLISTAAPSPFIKSPMNDWNFADEPSIKGGAKSFEESTASNGQSDKSKYIITLNDKGEYLQSKLVTEAYNKTYISDFKRNAAGRLEEIVQTIQTTGEPDIINSRQKATYDSKGKLVSIACERCLTKKELQPEGTATIEVAAHGTKTVTMKDDKGNNEMTQTFSYDKQGRVISASMTFGSHKQGMKITRNAAGDIASMEAEGQGKMNVEYEKDAKGNWTKATVSFTMKGPDGKEMKRVEEKTRKFTY